MADRGLSGKASALVRNFENAVTEYAWLSSKPKEDHDRIREKYAEARKKLSEFIKGLERAPRGAEGEAV